MTPKADNLAMETEPVVRNNNIFLKKPDGPGDKRSDIIRGRSGYFV